MTTKTWITASINNLSMLDTFRLTNAANYFLSVEKNFDHTSLETSRVNASNVCFGRYDLLHEVSDLIDKANETEDEEGDEFKIEWSKVMLLQSMVAGFLHTDSDWCAQEHGRQLSSTFRAMFNLNEIQASFIDHDFNPEAQVKPAPKTFEKPLAPHMILNLDLLNPTYQILLAKAYEHMANNRGIYGLENVANLDKLGHDMASALEDRTLRLLKVDLNTVQSLQKLTRLLTREPKLKNFHYPFALKFGSIWHMVFDIPTGTPFEDYDLDCHRPILSAPESAIAKDDPAEVQHLQNVLNIKDAPKSKAQLAVETIIDIGELNAKVERHEELISQLVDVVKGQQENLKQMFNVIGGEKK